MSCTMREMTRRVSQTGCTMRKKNKKRVFCDFFEGPQPKKKTRSQQLKSVIELMEDPLKSESEKRL
eukprot:UN12266